MALRGAPRHLDWEGCWNARDLGGLRTRDGRTTKPRALIRSENLCQLKPAGWAALSDHGVRTIIDLRRPSAGQAIAMPPTGIEVVRIPISEGLADDPQYAGWGKDGTLTTPLYFRDFMTRWPQRVAATVRAVAQARPGGVLVHCNSGRDRTGLVAMVLLATGGVVHEDIAADYEATSERVCRPLARQLGAKDDSDLITEVLTRHGTNARTVMLETLAWLDGSIDRYLDSAGVAGDDRAAVRARLVG